MSIFKYKKRSFEKDNDEFQKSVGSMLSHELTTPLTAISTSSSAIMDNILKLIKVYKIAHEADIDIPIIEDNHLDILLRCITNITKEAKTSLFLVYLISFILKTEGKNTFLEKVEIKKLVDVAISKFIKEYFIHNKKINISNKLETCDLIVHVDSAKAVISAVFYNIMQKIPINYTVDVVIDSIQTQFKYFLNIRYNIDTKESNYIANLSPELYFCEKYMNLINGSLEILNDDNNNICFQLLFKKEV